jgi:hypothetical protein
VLLGAGHPPENEVIAMKIVLALAAVAPLALFVPGCGTEAGQEAGYVACVVLGTAANHLAGAPLVSCTDPGSGSGTSASPTPTGQAFDSPTNTCVSCGATSCAAQTLACYNDTNCVCLVRCRGLGNTEDACSTECNATFGATTDAVISCAMQNCPAECTGFASADAADAMGEGSAP